MLHPLTATRPCSPPLVAGFFTFTAEADGPTCSRSTATACDTLVVRWVDRLGRNYQDVCDTIREFMRRGVVIRTVINNMTFDGATKDPMQQAVRDALIRFMAALGEAQAEATKVAQRAGIAYAKEFEGRYPGRKPSF